MDRMIEYVFFIYFVTHIPISIFVDSQVLLPERFYPTQLTETLDWYCRTFKDPLMSARPTWFLCFVIYEIFVHVPFFFVAVYALWKGTRESSWIRLPFVVYSTHVITTVSCIFYYIFSTNFQGTTFPSPKTIQEKQFLSLIYFPYLLIPCLILYDSLFSLAYCGKQKIS